MKNVGWLFPDRYCLKDKRTGECETFNDPEDAALFLRMHGSNTVNAGGTDTLKELSDLGYNSKGEKQGILGIFGL
ncbi:hypothetical protein IKF63_02410 [Candidatus Saccharibacteria bacterium]|nr:hypothetical protein [Candidatus Saccharibacteria bacterium]